MAAEQENQMETQRMTRQAVLPVVLALLLRPPGTAGADLGRIHPGRAGGHPAGPCAVDAGVSKSTGADRLTPPFHNKAGPDEVIGPCFIFGGTKGRSAAARFTSV